VAPDDGLVRWLRRSVRRLLIPAPGNSIRDLDVLMVKTIIESSKDSKQAAHLVVDYLGKVWLDQEKER
jgi:hypothetical protein